MENPNSTLEQNINTVTPVVAPMVAPVATPVAAPVVPPVQLAVAPAMPKHSHKRLVVLLAVFAVMGGALAAIGILKPDLVTSTIAWVTGTSMHAVTPDTRVLVNGEWVETSNPEAELAKVKKPEAKPQDKSEVTTSTMPVLPGDPSLEPGAAPVNEMVVSPAADDSSAMPAAVAGETTEPASPAESAKKPVVDEPVQNEATPPEAKK